MSHFVVTESPTHFSTRVAQSEGGEWGEGGMEMQPLKDSFHLLPTLLRRAVFILTVKYSKKIPEAV